MRVRVFDRTSSLTSGIRYVEKKKICFKCFKRKYLALCVCV